MLLRKALDFIFIFFILVISSKETAWPWNCWVNETARVTERAITVRSTHVTIAFDQVESKLLVCVPWAAHEDSSSPPASHGSSAPCSGTSQGMSMPQVWGTGSRRGLLSVFWLCASLSFERSTRKLLLNPWGLFFLPSSSTLYSVFTFCLCNFSQLTDVQRKT